MDAIGAVLDNDAHVVHTKPDGSGGNYAACHTTIRVYLGDTDVSDHLDSVKVTVSEGITGTWNDKTRTYQVTDMNTDSGYVDIEAQYGLDGKVLQISQKILTVGGKTLEVKAESARIKKRFSISKSKDGKVGISYNIQASTLVIKKQKDGKSFIPPNITFSAYKNDDGLVSSYSGVFQIEESKDNGKTFNVVYGTASPELLKVYTPTDNDVDMIKCTLYDASGAQRLDTQTVTAIVDAEG